MTSNEAEIPGEEIFPHLVYRVSGEQMECALWTLDEGHKALALFLTQESAKAYIEAIDLESDWQTICPGRTDLLEILRQSTSSGIDLAVLDPDAKQAKRIFDLREVVKAMRE
jgi:hypothetical protein